ncbi:MAG: HIT domain-containing protein [Bacteroidota bacterium]
MPDFYCDQVLSGKLQVDVIFESDLVLAFHHTRPFFEHHVVIIPKAHINSLSEPDAVDATLAYAFLSAIQHVTAQLEATTGGCRVSSNVGDYQSTKHLHWYVHAGKRLRHEDGTVIDH